MRTISLQTELATAADRVWDAVRSPATFLYVCRGLFGVPALAGRVERFRVGECGTAWLWAFHIFPAYRHTIEVIDVDDTAMMIRTHEHGGIISTWSHTLQVRVIDAGRCCYSDTIDVDAGPLTSVVGSRGRGHLSVPPAALAKVGQPASAPGRARICPPEQLTAIGIRVFRRQLAALR